MKLSNIILRELVHRIFNYYSFEIKVTYLEMVTLEIT